MSMGPKSRFATILAASAALVALETGCASIDTSSRDASGASRTKVGPGGVSHTTRSRDGDHGTIAIDPRRITLKGGTRAGSTGVTLDTGKAYDWMKGVLGGGAPAPQAGNGTTPTPLADGGTAPAAAPAGVPATVTPVAPAASAAGRAPARKAQPKFD